MTRTFQYDAIDQKQLSEALGRDGVVEISLTRGKAWACVRLLDNLNRLRSYRIGPKTLRKRVSLLRDAVFGILLNTFIYLAYPRLSMVLGFYVQEQPVYELKTNGANRLFFKRFKSARSNARSD